MRRRGASLEGSEWLAGAARLDCACHAGREASTCMRGIRSSGTSVRPLREYDAWGDPLQGAPIAGYAFTGREWDPETGLYYYRARYYDPKVGRFLSEDPLLRAVGSEASSSAGRPSSRMRTSTTGRSPVSILLD